MLPTTSITLSTTSTEDIPSYTYKLDPDSKRIIGHVDSGDSVVQAIRKIFETERFAYPIYTDQYGSEFESLIGQDPDFVQGVLESRIQDALSSDDRVLGLQAFEIVESKNDSMVVECTVSTIFGLVEIREEVLLR